MGYVYKVLVAFNQETINIDRREVRITDGMTAIAEIKNHVENRERKMKQGLKGEYILGDI